MLDSHDLDQYFLDQLEQEEWEEPSTDMQWDGEKWGLK